MLKWVALVFGLLAMPSLAATDGSQATSAMRHVDAIYAALPSDRFDFRKLRYAPELSALLKRDAAVAKGEVGALDFVPFCGCQDIAPDYAFTSKGVATPTGATVTVMLTNSGRRRFTIDLVDSRMGWLVADIHSSDIPSLLAYLRENVPMDPKK